MRRSSVRRFYAGTDGDRKGPRPKTFERKAQEREAQKTETQGKEA
ncbi:MAG: hypothetical protein Q9N34_05285 [Aquificota bacterium]|nr:hypothetical protein [Aquificota bacterium]